MFCEPPADDGEQKTTCRLYLTVSLALAVGGNLAILFAGGCALLGREAPAFLGHVAVGCFMALSSFLIPSRKQAAPERITRRPPP